MKRAILLAFVLMLLGGCSSRQPPDLSRVLGQTPEGVRDYLGDPKESGPDSEDYELTANGRKVTLIVKYQNGKAALAVPVPALSGDQGRLPPWTERDYKSWVGENCAVEVETLLERLHVMVRPPCTPRVYNQ